MNSFRSVIEYARIGRYSGIDALRAAAVLLVVGGHAGLGSFGDSGVTLFFVISGFVITRTVLVEYEKTDSFSISGFYWRRSLKLLPPLLLIVVIPSIFLSGISQEKIDGLAVFSQVFFFYNWVEIFQPIQAELILPGSQVVWSLAVEEQFYIIFALVWIVIINFKKRVFILALISALVFVYSTLQKMWLAFDVNNATYILRATDARADAIALGILLAISFQRGIPTKIENWLRSGVPLYLSVITFFACFFIRETWFIQGPRYTIQALAAGIMVISAVEAKSDNNSLKYFYRLSIWRPVIMIGLASYSIYLAHDVVNKLILVSQIPDKIGNFTTALSLISGILLGILCFVFIEVPIAKWKHAIPNESKQAKR